MGRILLKRTSRFKPSVEGGDTWSVTSWYHDTLTYQDARTTSDELSDPGPFVAPSDVPAGFYCRHTTRYDVYHNVALDGTSRLENFPSATECPLPPEPEQPPLPPRGAVGLNNDPQAPAGAKLLKRQCKPANPAGFTYTDKYYDYQTRTIVSLNSPPDYIAETCTAFTFPAGETIDQYCLEPGVAPYVAREFFWDGLNALDFRDIEGVSACELPACTLSLQATVTQPGVSGLGVVTLTALQANGGVVFNREGSSEAPTTNPVFLDLPPGRYVFRAAETRENGCTATVEVTLVAVYGVRYRLNYLDFWNRPNALLFRERGYTGPEELVPYGQKNAVTLDWPGGALDHVYTNLLRGSEADLRLFITYDGQFLDTFSGDERLYQIEHVLEGSLFWRGWLLPEQYTVVHLAPPVEFNLRATDGLGALDGLDFTGPLGELLEGQWTLLRVVQHCLSRIGLELPLHVLCTIYPAGASLTLPALEQVYVDVAAYRDSKQQPWDCGKVLHEVLSAFGLRLMQCDGAWWLERVADLTTSVRTYHAYAPDGTATGTVQAGVVRSITLPTEEADPFFWIGAQQIQGVLGAVRKVELEAKPEGLTNFLAQQASLLPDTLDENNRPKGWIGAAPAVVLPSTKRNTGGTLLLTGAAPGTAELAADFIQLPASTPLPTAPEVFLRLGFTATLRSTQPIPEGLPAGQLPRLLFSIRHGSTWIGGNFPTATSSPRYGVLAFEALGQTHDYESSYTRDTSENPDYPSDPVTIRFLQVAAPLNHARYDVEISNITLTWNAPGTEENYIDFTVAESELLVSRLDTGSTFFHTDTPRARLQGSLLTAKGLPTEQWFEAARPSQLAPLLAYLAAYRLAWQITPAQTLAGDVRGTLSPMDLLHDPQETRPAVYVLTSARYDTGRVVWSLSATQLRTLLPPGLEDALTGALLWEDGTPMLFEDSQPLLTEDATT